MKQITLIILTLLSIISCKNNSININESQTLNFNSDKSTTDSIDQTIISSYSNDSNSYDDLSDVFAKAAQTFPDDSASLYRFYFKQNSTLDQDKLNKQIKRLENLTSKESVARYRSIKNNLIPLMTRIVKSNAINKSQSDSLVNLYSGYDYFTGESLFYQLLTNDQHYELVCQSFLIMVEESKKDTCYISGLIKLENNNELPRRKQRGIRRALIVYHYEEPYSLFQHLVL